MKYDVRISHRDPKTKKLILAWVRPFHPRPYTPGDNRIPMGPGILTVIKIAPTLQKLWNEGFYQPTRSERKFYNLLDPAVKRRTLNALGIRF